MAKSKDLNCSMSLPEWSGRIPGEAYKALAQLHPQFHFLLHTADSGLGQSLMQNKCLMQNTALALSTIALDTGLGNGVSQNSYPCQNVASLEYGSKCIRH